MPAPQSELLPSRAVVVSQLIDSCLEPALSELPVILLWSSRGERKEMLLNHMLQLFSGWRPCAFIDFATIGPARPHEVANRLAFALSERVKDYDSPSFPRLHLGQVIIRTTIDLDNHATARADLKSLLKDKRRLRGTTRQVLTGLAQEAANVAAAAGGVEVGEPLRATAAGLAVDAVDAAVRSVGHAIDGSARWYRQALSREFADDIEALIELNARWAEGTDEARAEVEEVLCRAFLADLAASAARRGILTAPFKGACVALLDNADAPAGQDFLDTFTAVRHRYHTPHPEESGADKLLVVAAGHTRFPEFATRSGRGLAAAPPRRADHAGWYEGRRRRHDRSRESWFYAVAITDLDDDDVDVQVRRQAGPLGVTGPVDFVTALTGGHPWGFDLVRRAVSTAARTSRSDVDLRRALTFPDPDGSAATVADLALDQLLAGVGPQVREDLVTCSAARDISKASRRCALGATMDRESAQLERFCSADLLVSVASGPDAGRTLPHPFLRRILPELIGGEAYLDSPAGARREERTLHPFLRRLLLPLLAARPDHDPSSWWAVHQRLAASYRERDDEVGALYHELALDNLAAAAGHLDDKLEKLPVEQWLRDLAVITAAPRRAQPGDARPRHQVRALVRDVPVDAHVANLVAALWVDADPLGDPTGDLCVPIAAHLDHLADRLPRDMEIFQDLADAFRRRGRDRDWPADGRTR